MDIRIGSIEFWLPESEAIHGIGRDDLDAEGSSTDEVLDWFRGVNNGIAISDAPEFDARWLGRLLSLTEEPPQVQMLDFFSYAAMVLPTTGAFQRTVDHMKQTDVPHRAEPDARRMAQAVLEGMKA
ncbi:hypothetical protein [Roseivivax sp. CAU 1761]